VELVNVQRRALKRDGGRSGNRETNKRSLGRRKLLSNLLLASFIPNQQGKWQLNFRAGKLKVSVEG